MSDLAIRRRDPVSPQFPAATPTGPLPPKPDEASLETGSMSSDRRRFVATVSAVSSSGAASIEERLDAARRAFTPTYRVGSERVAVPTQFRMNGGWNDRKEGDRKNDILRELPDAQFKTGTKLLLRAGRATPEDLARATQALIDRGKLPDVTRTGDRSIEARVKQMQWDWSIGIDCAGCVQQTLMRALGKTREQLGFAKVDDENLSRLATNPHFSRVDLGDAKPGDAIVLGPPKGDSVGHTVVVASHRGLGLGEVPKMRGASPADVRRFCERGNVEAYEVDSS